MANLKIKKTLVLNELEAEVWQKFDLLLEDLKTEFKDEAIENLSKEFERFHKEVRVIKPI